MRWDVSEICGFSEMITVCPYGSTCVGATGDGTRGAASGERDSSHDLRDETTFTVSATHRIARGKRIG